MRITRSPRFWSAHTHSQFSAQDAMDPVAKLVDRVAALGQPALGLTDHGNMAGSVQLYQACRKAGIKPFPGSELYVVKDLGAHKAFYRDKEVESGRYHMGVLAFTTTGYENLVRLSTISHKQFYYKPLIDLITLARLSEAKLAEGLAFTTGCYFGLVAQTLVHKGEKAAGRYLRVLDSWFPGNVYVEIQNHDIDHGDGWSDDKVADALLALADEIGLPVIITQDSHYCDESDRSDHDALKQLVAYGPDPDETVFPGDGFHLADDAWIERHHTGRRLERGLEGLRSLLDRHDLSIGVLDDYHYQIPHTHDDPSDVLRQRCEDALPHRKTAYLERLEAELDVINHAGMAGYLLLTADITDYMRANTYLFQTRGSAAGSLVCYLLGISNVDPIKWDLRFERFLSKDRTKPPDIDLDIQHDRREELIAWMKTRWTVNQIGTWREMSLTTDDPERTKGSLMVRYYAASGKKGPKIDKWEDVPHEDREQLRRLDERKMISDVGKNAAGFVITASRDQIDKLVPMMWIASSSTMLTQYDKDDIEKLGLVKLDAMGLKTLSSVSQTLTLLGKDDLEWIPAGHGPTYSAIRSGMTEGVFQLSGFAAQRGCRDLKPSKISDVIAAMALFRPATMNSGATASYVSRKHGLESTPQRHELIMQATKDTYGIMLYQEQVIAILRALGMEAEDLTKFLKAVKASNKDIGNAGEVIAGYQVMIAQLCTAVDMSVEDQKWLAKAIDGFSAYGFNSAHATVYGLMAYRTAYLMVNHPIEFHTGLLHVAAGDSQKEPKYLKAARARGVKVMRSDINTSHFTYTMDRERQGIRKGLLAIDGIGKVTAKELVQHQPYQSVSDLLSKINHRVVTGAKNMIEKNVPIQETNGAMKALYDAGALDSLLDKR